LADVAASRAAIEATGTPVAFVHASTPVEADQWFARAGLATMARVSDPGLAHYRAFGLDTTGVGALLNPRVWLRGAVCAARHGFGPQPGHLIRQLPGVFVVHGRRVLAEFRHASPSDRPDYVGMIGRAKGVTML
jgi:hypothetical protein